MEIKEQTKIQVEIRVNYQAESTAGYYKTIQKEFYVKF